MLVARAVGVAESAWIYKRSDVKCHRYYAFRRHDDEQYLCLISLYVDLLRDNCLIVTIFVVLTPVHATYIYIDTKYIRKCSRAGLSLQN